MKSLPILLIFLGALLLILAISAPGIQIAQAAGGGALIGIGISKLKYNR